VSGTTRGLLERLDHVETPNHKWPGKGDTLKGLHWQVGLASIELTPLHVRTTSSALRSAVGQ
jgi:hypothetical protein